MPLIERKVQNKSSWRDHFKINKKLLPLKFTLFFFSASAFSILPYLTIHMKDIGIKVEHIALMYAILPFTIFFGKNNSAINSKLSSWKKNQITFFFVSAPPFVGYMADKLGSYTRVLVLTLLGSGVFHTVLLFLPSVSEVTTYPVSSSFEFIGTSAVLKWSKCSDGDFNTCPTWTKNWPMGNSSDSFTNFEFRIYDFFLLIILSVTSNDQSCFPQFFSVGAVEKENKFF